MKRLVILNACLALSLAGWAQDNRNDSLRMDSIIHSLPDVMVKGNRPIVKVKGAALTYDLPQLIKNHLVDNAYEAIKQLPGVERCHAGIRLLRRGGHQPRGQGDPEYRNGNRDPDRHRAPGRNRHRYLRAPAPRAEHGKQRGAGDSRGNDDSLLPFPLLLRGGRHGGDAGVQALAVPARQSAGGGREIHHVRVRRLFRRGADERSHQRHHRAAENRKRRRGFQ